MSKQLQRRFTDDEVREIIDQHQRMNISEIARLFKAHPSTIHNIVTGKTYRNVTHDTAAGKTCQCPACRTSKQADANVALILDTNVAILCFYCQRPTQVTVRRGLDMHGEISCGTCAGGSHE
ncbi:transposase family protein [Nocardia sp. NPDC050712]|uniref:transposase family protein n=1 Tax=Nocardia sp. NPDC050712 TaxID=3155518 RepID=UPI0033C84F2B